MSRPGSSGLFCSKDEVACEVGTTKWLPLPHSAVEQGNKVRQIADASVSGSEVNMGAAISKRLEVPSTDNITAAIRDAQYIPCSNAYSFSTRRSG